MLDRAALPVQGGVRFLRPVGEEETDRNIATERACAADSWNVGGKPSPSALILVLLLSFGLWAAIWGAFALLAMDGRW
jgi:hypothetical protein